MSSLFGTSSTNEGYSLVPQCERGDELDDYYYYGQDNEADMFAYEDRR